MTTAQDDPQDDPQGPQLRPRHDGIYPRCVWCRRELYVLAVLAYSSRDVVCHACGRLLPEDYVRR